MELGTYEYPYRTYAAASSEILNHYSHSEIEVKIYGKDGHIEIDTMYFINLTKVSLLRHPDYELIGKSTQLVWTSEPQVGISSKARFHLLTGVVTDPAAVIAAGTWTDTEAIELITPLRGIKSARTSLELNGIQNYAEDTELLLAPIYLQEKEIRISKQMLF